MKIVTYRRVSTSQQERSGLGLEAQSAAIDAWAERTRATTVGTYTEIESGRKNTRPELTAALHLAKVTGATLVIAKLDRLSRNAAFLLTLRDSGVRFIAVDMPDANELTVGIMALVAQQERQAISTRTREALAAARRRGVQLGNPNGARALRMAGRGNKAATASVKGRANAHAEDLRSVVKSLGEAGVTTLAAIAVQLNTRGMRTPRDAKWHPASVRNLLQRLKTLS
ncbi:MAG: Resolvase, N-terminal [Betaproteobacteria bacterium]|nr:Resolvase, N-terminal [Betaproteobacteria bacterium]